MIVESQKDRIILLFGTAEKDVRKACLSIVKEIRDASNKRHDFINKVKIKTNED